MRRDESVEKESDEIQIIDPPIDPTPQKIQKEIDYRPDIIAPLPFRCGFRPELPEYSDQNLTKNAKIKFKKRNWLFWGKSHIWKE